MLAAVVFASVLPDVGRSGGWLHLDRLSDVGIFALFFLHGMGLSTRSLRSGASLWRLHLLVQSCTYIVFPLWWLLFARVFGAWFPHDLLMGFFFLAVLPSTVSSSVAMTALARGNVAAAVLNATLSTLLGVFLTPLLVSLVMGSQTGGAQTMEVGQTMLKIAQMLLLPFVAGQVLRRWWGAWFARHKAYTSSFDRAVILVLVWSSFSDAVHGGLWTQHGAGLLVQTVVGASVFLFPMLWFTRWAARSRHFNVEDEIVAVFCGSKKTLASGMPMAKLLFGASAGLGVIVLPLMFYHQLQLLVCSILARRYARRIPAVRVI
ncbi:MAG: bile acid:sodium symporter [Burkholderiales bacterium]|nr:bile acid:sodium symporter [Burkholderiales bacterium]